MTRFFSKIHLQKRKNYEAAFINILFRYHVLFVVQ